MAKLAAGDEFTVSDMEVRREGATYTVDTLRRLRAQEPESELVYIIGADTLPNLVTWREYEEVFRLCTFAAARRGGGRGGRAGGRARPLAGGRPAGHFLHAHPRGSRPRAAICGVWWTTKWPRISEKRACT